MRPPSTRTPAGSARGIEADTVGYTDEQTRNARHGYYANVSYFDDWLGKLLTTLDETGLIDDTIVIVTSDHGDMLGDRGAWFKMSFFERSARVPLVIAGPGIATTRVPNVCSHLDLLPTLLEIAGAAAEPDAFVGRSLLPAASGADDLIDETFGEYAAEMTSQPIFMIRRGRHKYIHCDTDPPQLYDVVADPLERDNLADQCCVRRPRRQIRQGGRGALGFTRHRPAGDRVAAQPTAAPRSDVVGAARVVGPSASERRRQPVRAQPSGLGGARRTQALPSVRNEPSVTRVRELLNQFDSVWKRAAAFFHRIFSRLS